MEKLVRGIVEFRKNARPQYRETFAKLALGQAPDALFIACSDSRVVPNLFASTDPGDLFVIRNVGNLVAPHSNEGASEAAAIDFALHNLPVRDIIVCGHSDCGAMRALSVGRDSARADIRAWLRHGDDGRGELGCRLEFDPALLYHDQISQRNVLRQIEHLKTYPAVQRRIEERSLALHGWWFDIGRAEVQDYNEERGRFVTLDEREADRIIAQHGGK